MYSERGLEKKEAATGGARKAPQSLVDWERVRQCVPVKSQAGDSESDALIEALRDHLDSTVGPEAYDVEFAVANVKPAVVTCRLSISGALRSGVSAESASMREARADALLDAARLFGVRIGG